MRSAASGMLRKALGHGSHRAASGANVVAPARQNDSIRLAGVVGALWLHRPLIAGLVRREFQIQSARAVWGYAWLVIHPVILIGLYTFIFSRVLGARLPGSGDPLGYGLFLCAGLIHWNLFSELVTRCQSMFFEHSELLNTIRVPRSVLPAAVTLASMLRYLLVLGVFLLLLAATGRWPGSALLAGIPLLAILGLFGLGVGILSGTLNVFFRDVEQATSTVLQLWFWSTPIVYPLAILPERVSELIELNPLVPLMVAYQDIVLEQRVPDPSGLIWPATLALAVFILAWLVVRALGADLVDEL